MKAIASRDNADYKAMARLVSSASERRKTGLSVLDGPHLLGAYLDSGARPEALFVSRAGLDDAEVAGLVERAAPARVTLLSDALYDALSTVESPTGVLACVRTPQGREAPPDARLALLLEDIQDPGNVGTLLRSAAAAGADHVLLSPRCAFAWSPKVLRAAMGAHFAVNIAEGVDLAAWLAAYRGRSVALAGRGGTSLYDVDLRGPVALLVGNEGAGLSKALLDAAAVKAHIPMAGRIESLNAASAGVVALFETVRQRKQGRG
ncbi:MAG TPA: RNA methyltransferase [Usitatibacter sp.]|nr:RNA methyltransferase [Usitatibacter sp.]